MSSITLRYIEAISVPMKAELHYVKLTLILRTSGSSGKDFSANSPMGDRWYYQIALMQHWEQPGLSGCFFLKASINEKALCVE